MSTVADYELHYDLFIAEQELFDNMISYQFDIVTESVGLISLNESMKENVMKYIERITTAIQKAWDKFRDIVTRSVDKAYLEKIKDKMANPNPKFTIKNYFTYNSEILDNIKVIPFDYIEMRDSLGSKTDFVTKYYPNLITDSDKSFSTNMRVKIITGAKDTKCTSEMMIQMYNFVTKIFPNKIKNVENDLKTVNTSNKNIKQIVNQTISNMPSESENKPENNNSGDGEQQSHEHETVYMLGDIYIREDDNTGADGKKVRFEDDKKKETMIKQVNIYLSTSTDILSTKMEIYRDIYAMYMNTIKHYIDPKIVISKDKKDDLKQNTNGENTENIEIEV